MKTKQSYDFFSKQTLIIAIVITILALLIAFQNLAGREMYKFLIIFPHVVFIEIVFEWLSASFTGPEVLISPVILLCSSFLPSLLYARLILGVINLLKKVPFPQPVFTVLAALFLCIMWVAVAIIYTPYVIKNGDPPPCSANLKQMGLVISMYGYDNEGEFPVGATSGDIFKKLEREGYLKNREILSCPANPVKDIDFNNPNGTSYYIDPTIPKKRDEKSPIMADKPPWGLNHNEGVNVLFKDGTAEFIRPNDREPKDKISNPYIEEDTDIYADTGDPEKHAWIGWAKKTEIREKQN